METLTSKTCQVCEGGTPALSSEEVDKLLKQVQGWTLNGAENMISKTFQFKGYGKTMAFTNAVAWIANQEGHHPDMEVSYNRCTVNFTTHAVDGLTENDFICAAKVDALI